ncbi:MAG: DUF401 family protein, partial [Planctomycetes bacterium]|nr:DUF401 family protein [Planctomycetota bacterium]
MYVLIAMGLSLGVLVVLLARGVRIGRAMLCAAVAFAVLLRVSPAEVFRQLTFEFHNEQTGLAQTTPYLFISLTALLLGVNVIGALMQETGISKRLIGAMQGLFRSRRVAMAVLPLLMGMLPTPGGIMLSAPMVRDLGDGIGVGRSRQAAINFYFRHQWESVWPLFPAVPLLQGILGVSAFSVISHNIVISIAGICAGVLFLLLAPMPPRDKTAARPGGRLHHNLRDFTHAFWPIALTAVLYGAFNLPPAVGIWMSVFGLMFLHKIPRHRWAAMFKAANEADLVLLVFSALFFKLNLEAGGAIGDVVGFFQDVHLPPVLIIFLLPFLVGFLSGVTMPTVAMTFPFLAAFIGTGADAKMPLATLGFAGLMCGLFLTPVHLCLPLSAAYFQTSLSKIIARLILPAVVTAAIVIAVIAVVWR